jgi:hypothetical protein
VSYVESARIIGPLVVSILAYSFWHYFRSRNGDPRAGRRLLFATYLLSRLGLWLVFALYMQRHVALSDPRLYYMPMLEHFLAGEVPIREFFYPYGPLLMPSILPFYQLLGRNLAGISAFAVLAEAIALICFYKSVCLLERRGEISRSRVTEALAIYLLNPATLYWTVFQGYHSIVQTAYSLGALYFLLKDRYAIGYAVGLFSVAGSKFLAVLDWPALLAIRRPRIGKLCLGAIPLVITYAVFEVITGDILFPLRYHATYKSEGNVWYLLTIFGDTRSFYSAFPGNLLPAFSFGVLFFLGFGRWLRHLNVGLVTFSYQRALGMTTFSMSLFFPLSFYSGNYYVPMLMLPASFLVTCPPQRRQHAVWALLLISGLCVSADVIWTQLGQPGVLRDVVLSDSLREQSLACLLTASIIVRLICFAILAQLSLHVATTSQCSDQMKPLTTGVGQVTF